MKNFHARGDALEFTAGADIASGDVVAVGNLIGIAAGDVANGGEGIMNLTGVYGVPKVGSQAWGIGDPVYWNGTAATKTAGTNKFMGNAAAVVGSGAGETLGLVRLASGVPVSWGT